MAVHPMQPELTTQLWEQVLETVERRLGSPQAFETWFRPIVPLEVSPQLVELEVPNAFFVDWIHEHHLPLLRQILAEALGRAPEVRFSARESLPALEAPTRDLRDLVRQTSVPSTPANRAPID